MENLIGDLCKKDLERYSYMGEDFNPKYYMSHGGKPNEGWMKMSKAEFKNNLAYNKQMRRKLESFCGFILDEHVRNSFKICN